MPAIRNRYECRNRGGGSQALLLMFSLFVASKALLGSLFVAGVIERADGKPNSYEGYIVLAVGILFLALAGDAFRTQRLRRGPIVLLYREGIVVRLVGDSSVDGTTQAPGLFRYFWLILSRRGYEAPRLCFDWGRLESVEARISAESSVLLLQGSATHTPGANDEPVAHKIEVPLLELEQSVAEVVNSISFFVWSPHDRDRLTSWTNLGDEAGCKLTVLPWDIDGNKLGGKSLWITGRGTTPLSEIPARFQAVLNDAAIAAIESPSAYFGQLAERCKFEDMREFLDEARREAKNCICEIATSQSRDAMILWSIGMPKSGKRSLGIEPATGCDLPHLTPSLRHLYSLVGGTYEREFGVTGGVVRPESLTDLARSVWLSDENTVDPAGAVLFCQSTEGDALVAKGETAYWYLRDSGVLIPAGGLAETISSYFTRPLQMPPRPHHAVRTPSSA